MDALLFLIVRKDRGRDEDEILVEQASSESTCSRC